MDTALNDLVTPGHCGIQSRYFMCVDDESLALASMRSGRVRGAFTRHRWEDWLSVVYRWTGNFTVRLDTSGGHIAPAPTQKLLSVDAARTESPFGVSSGTRKLI